MIQLENRVLLSEDWGTPQSLADDAVPVARDRRRTVNYSLDDAGRVTTVAAGSRYTKLIGQYGQPSLFASEAPTVPRNLDGLNSGTADW